MKRKLQLAAGAAVAMALGQVQAASNEANAHITRLRVDPNNKAVITFDKIPTGKPSCATYGSGEHLALSLTTDSGREQFRLAMAAYLAGKTVTFTGSGACVVHVNKEDLSDLYVY